MGAMERNRALLEKFFTSLAGDDHEAMAECYAPEATFDDIAFELRGKKKIHAMWHMITDSDLCMTYRVESCGPRDAVVCWVARYTFGETEEKPGRRVRNELCSTFVLQDGLIVGQHDHSDARRWCVQALGPIKGPLAWMIPRLREGQAAKKLEDFIGRHPQYR
jgi:hypothetical protein